MTYDIGPITPYLAINGWSTNFTDLVSYPSNPEVTVKSATVDPKTGKLVVILEYSEDVHGKDLDLVMTPPNVSQAYLVPDITHSWTVEPTNRLTAFEYSDEDY